MNITSIIIDDEEKLRKVLELKLEKYCEGIEVLDSVDNASDAYDSILQFEPDVVFLDISMPGESGFELLERFDELDFEIIFVTGYNNYVLNALKVSAVDYLLKPVVTADLIAAVSKAKERVEKKDKIEMYDVLKHNLNHVGDQVSKVVIPGTNSYDFVPIKNIIRCEGWQKYTKVHIEGGTTLVSSYNIGVFKNMLTEYQFYSVHKSHLVNIRKIVRYHIDGRLELSDDSIVPVSRRRRETFINDVINSMKIA